MKILAGIWENEVGKYIYMNYFGMQVFDEYFKYLDEIKGIIPVMAYNFFRDEERYFLHGDKTFHDAWMVEFQYVVNEDSFTNWDKSSYSAKLKLVNSKLEKLFLLNYKNVEVHSFPCNLVYADFFRLDILYHELTWHELDRRCQHTLYFDDEKFIKIFFTDFEYLESNFKGLS